MMAVECIRLPKVDHVPNNDYNHRKNIYIVLYIPSLLHTLTSI